MQFLLCVSIGGRHQNLAGAFSPKKMYHQNSPGAFSLEKKQEYQSFSSKMQKILLLQPSTRKEKPCQPYGRQGSSSRKIVLLNIRQLTI